MKPDALYGDAVSYWMHSKEFVVDNHFSFFNYTHLLRGYVFPFILFLQRGCGMFPENVEIYLWALSFGMMFSTIVIYQLPWMSKTIFGKEMNWKRIALLEVVLLFFWWGNLVYPLSDFYALFFLNFSIILFYKINKAKEDDGKKYIVTIALGIGVCAYITYSIRAMYMFFFVALIVFWVINQRKYLIKMLGILFVIFIGALTISVPQIIINSNVEGIYSPMVLGIRDGEKINDMQLFWGLYYSRYETYIGDYDVYPNAGVIFEDKAGKRIIEEEGIDGLTTIEAIKLYLKYPLDIIGIMSRHLVNAMDNRFPELYIKDLYKDRSFICISNFLIWFLFFSFFTISKKKCKIMELKEKIADKYQYIFLMCISSCAMLVGAIEIRFFLPIYCLVYVYVISEGSREVVQQGCRKWGIGWLVMAGVMMIFYTSVCGNTLMQIQEGVPILFRN